MRQVFSVFFLILSVQFLFSQPFQIQENWIVLIDTDCGTSDYRALNLLLYQPELHIAGIIISDGIVDPDNGFIKISGLLKEAGKDTIPVGIGKIIKNIHSDERKNNQTSRWSKYPVVSAPRRPAQTLVSDVLNKSEKKITYICLGPLSNLGCFIDQKPELIQKIDRIIWYNDQMPHLKGFNYEFDSLAAKKIFSSDLRFDIISNLDRKNAVFDTLLLSGNDGSSTAISKNLHEFYQMNDGKDNYDMKQLILSDELLCVYLCNPYLFDMNPRLGKIRQRYNTDYNVEAVREVISDMVYGIYYPEKNIVFTRFPAERKMFSYDVRQIMDSVISRYGDDEWKACIVTNEFHGHLGEYSIVGAKMGIKAREIFGVGMDILQVVSYAGFEPPYSCLNDGIQVSTGSTLGLGLISIAPVDEIRIMADFTYKGKTIRLSLKDEYLEKVESDISEGIVKFGLMDEGYWKLIRQSALKYWLEWDRDKIFNIEESPFNN